MSTLLLLVASVGGFGGGGQLPMSWIEPPGEAGNARAATVCLPDNGACRSGAHLIFAIHLAPPTTNSSDSPTSLGDSLLVGAETSYDDGATWQAAPPAVSETHFAGGTSKVYTWGHDSLSKDFKPKHSERVLAREDCLSAYFPGHPQKRNLAAAFRSAPFADYTPCFVR